MRTPLTAALRRIVLGAGVLLAASAVTTRAVAQDLRDAYHQAPRDTVTQDVYDGWKQFNLNCADILSIAQTAGIAQRPLVHGWRDHLWDACRARVRPLLDTLARRVDAKATWDDIVLPREDMTLLRQIASQVKHRSVVAGRAFQCKALDGRQRIRLHPADVAQD